MLDHHALSAAAAVAAASRNGVAHYEHYLAPPPASHLLAAEQQRRLERERIIMADRELEHREKELVRIRHMEQQRQSYYNAAVNVSIGNGRTSGVF